LLRISYKLVSYETLGVSSEASHIFGLWYH